MRSFVLVLGLAALCAAPAGAGTILYATAASHQAVDGFCINSDGSLDTTPVVHVATDGTLPRRLVVRPDPATGKDGALYVAETDRVQAFPIGNHGGLGRPSAQVIEHPAMSPLDVAVSPDGRLLYVPDNGRHRILAYPLDADGAFAGDFQTCVNGPPGAQYQRLLVRNGFLYVSAAVLGGRISVFPLAADGSLELQAEACKGERGSADETCPRSERRKLLTPDPFVITDAGILYVESLSKRQILAFQLINGQFAPTTKKETGEIIDVCVNEKKDDPEKGPFRYQKPLDKTAVLQQYHDLVLHASGQVVFGSQFTHGRVDAYKLKSNGKLPSQPTQRTHEDLRQSPVGIAVSEKVLYVATGELDRVQAFPLKGTTGKLASNHPFSETDERTGSFPNALAIAELSGSCGP